MVEQLTENHRVASSILAIGTNKIKSKIMSKKNKNKKKKQKIQKRVQNFAPTFSVGVPTHSGVGAPTSSNVGMPAVEIVERKIVGNGQVDNVQSDDVKPTVPKVVADESESIIDEKSRRFISRDVKIIILTIVILAILLTTVKILQLKTGIINHFADWLFKIAHIQTS